MAPPNVVSRVVSSVLEWVGLGPFVSDAPSTSNAPLTPVQSPVLWAVLGWVRRQYQQTLAGETPVNGTTAVVGGQTVDPAVTDIAALSAPATLNATAAAATPAPPAFVQVSAATPQTSQSSVGVTFAGAQTAGNTNVVAIGWNNATSTITSVTDSAGNTYQLAVPTARGTGVSQATYYAPNIKAAAAGTNTVTATFNTATPYVDVRALEYSGLAAVSPFDVGRLGIGDGHHRGQRAGDHHRGQ